MLESLRDAIKQIIYKYWPYKPSIYYSLLNELFNSDLLTSNDIFKLPTIDGYLLTNFRSPALNAYQGKEIAFINDHQLSIYWLPGVLPRAKGKLNDGKYEVLMNGLILNSPIVISLTKQTDELLIHAVEQRTSDTAHRLKGCLLSYKQIEKELSYLISQKLVGIRNEIVSGQNKLNSTFVNRLAQYSDLLPDMYLANLCREVSSLYY